MVLERKFDEEINKLINNQKPKIKFAKNHRIPSQMYVMVGSDTTLSLHPWTSH